MQVKQYTDRGIKHREEIAPDGWIAIEIYSQHSMVPWDYHSRRHFKPLLHVLNKAGIATFLCEHSQEGTRLIGSSGGTGPEGRVRSGDNMIPSIYTLYVRDESKEVALLTIKTHQEEVSTWLASYGKPDAIPMPEALLVSLLCQT
jgi:hypothetical protein